MQNRLSHRNPLLPAALILALVFVLILAAFFLIPRVFPNFVWIPTQIAAVTSTPTPAPTGTNTPTATSTPRPTWTLRPSYTPTVTPTSTGTPTPTPLPTLNSANPLKYNDLYRLKEWDAAQADNAIALLESYPNSRFRTVEDRNSRSYFDSFYAAAIAQREALLRFPNDPLAAQWRWGLAYNLARTSNPDAGGEYANIIVEALNSNETSLETLPEWFGGRERRLTINILPLPLAGGYLSSSLVRITGQGSEGAAAFWLVQTPQDYRAYLLDSRFDFAGSVTTGYLVEDITGDSLPEVILFTAQQQVEVSNGTETSLNRPVSYTLDEPLVYSLNSTPPVLLTAGHPLPFNAGTTYEAHWEVQDGDLVQTITVFPGCPVTIQRSYHWDGEALNVQPFEITVQPSPGFVQQCSPVIDHAANVWGAQVAADIMEQLEDDWPPQVDVNGDPLPPDALDEFRYRRAVFEILAGNQEDGLEILRAIIAEPSNAASRWPAIAQGFLDAYEGPGDSYRACMLNSTCDPRLALKSVVATIPVEDYRNIPGYIEEFGITTSGSGLFDFENDGDPERWLLVRQRPDEKLELWVLVKTPEVVRALFVDVLETTDPEFWYHEPVEEPPVVQYELGNGFQMYRSEKGAEPYIVFVELEFIPTTYTLDLLNRSMDDLLSGKDPALVRETLKAGLESGRFNCRTYSICDRYDYVLGLSYELSGQSIDAIDTYIKLWWEQKGSLLTVLARLKLEQKPSGTPTAIPTTSTPPVTRTATAAPPGGTPTPIAPSPTASPTVSRTP